MAAIRLIASGLFTIHAELREYGEDHHPKDNQMRQGLKLPPEKRKIVWRQRTRHLRRPLNRKPTLCANPIALAPTASNCPRR